MTKKIYSVKIIPNSKINKIIEQKDDFIKVKITEPAHDGKANKALINFFSKEFKVAKNKIRIISGEKSRMKRILIS